MKKKREKKRKTKGGKKREFTTTFRGQTIHITFKREENKIMANIVQCKIKLWQC